MTLAIEADFPEFARLELAGKVAALALTPEGGKLLGLCVGIILPGSWEGGDLVNTGRREEGVHTGLSLLGERSTLLSPRRIDDTLLDTWGKTVSVSILYAIHAY